MHQLGNDTRIGWIYPQGLLEELDRLRQLPVCAGQVALEQKTFVSIPILRQKFVGKFRDLCVEGLWMAWISQIEAELDFREPLLGVRVFGQQLNRLQ